MPGFNLKDYEPVEERLARFWNDHPDGRISTWIHQIDEHSIIVAAAIFRHKDDPLSTATGLAQETPGSNPVNKTSWVENCETSAIGRALANMGYAPKGSRASREEMAKVAAPPSTRTPSRSRAGSRTKLRASQIALLQASKDAGVDDKLRHRIIYMLTSGTSESVHDLDDATCDQIKAQIVLFGENIDGNMKVLEQWEAKR